MNIYDQFIDVLIAQTRKREITWIDLFDFSHAQDGNGLDVLFYQGEYRTINMTNTSVTRLGNLIVSVIDEENISGRDNSVDAGINLYILNQQTEMVYLVPATPEKVLELHQLTIKFNARWNHELDEIIRDYLDDHPLPSVDETPAE